MQPPTVLIKLLGEAVFSTLQDSVLDDVSVEATPELAETVWMAWHRQGDDASLRAEVQALAQTSTADFDPVVHEIAAQVTGSKSGDASRSISNYLVQVPATVRGKFRRPADPSGTTLPAWLPLQRPADLLGLLPAQLPWFTPGDRPWEIGDWELVELLDVGGLGEVWKARNPRRQDVPPAALKFCLHPAARQRLLSGGRGGYEALLERVMREANQPGFVQLRHVSLAANPPCLEYEYVEGGDLAGLVRDWHAAAVPPSPALVAGVVLQLARTLGHVHHLAPPLVHRNLRPGGILVQQDPDGRLTCKIAGLGLGDLMPGRPATADATSAPAAPAGDASLYASPQQRRGEPADPRDDVYALGVLWYQMLTGNLAAGRPGGSQWRRRLTDAGTAAAMIELLESCFEDDAHYRRSDGAALAERLARLLPGASAVEPTAPKPPAAEPIPRARRVEPRPPAAETPAPARARPRRAGVWEILDSLEKAAPERPKLLTNFAGLKFVLIPAGSFLMGSPEGEACQREGEIPQHEVTITKPFYLGVYPVTQEQYQKVIGKNPSRFGPAAGGGPAHPVENVTWEDAGEFCRRLSELPAEKEAGRCYRLPTEAEWEYACRAGTATPFCYGPSLSAAQANFDSGFPYGGGDKGRALQKTSPVGAYPASNFGLYDMHGNVWEWCADWLDGGYYAYSPKRDPQGPPEGQFRVLRGGSWRNHAATCRAAYRNGLDPRARDLCTGFRVLLEAK